MNDYFFSYAQFFEDLILWDALKEIPHGKYIDAGANDPIEWSVTKVFYDKGWSGINIEPLVDKYRLLEKYRERDTNLNCGVSDEAGEMEMIIANDLSSFDGDTKRKLKHKGNTNNKTVFLNTITDIYKERFEIGSDIHFLKIDVEGFEENVLNGIDFSIVKPWIICIEHNHCKEWENIIIDAGYLFAMDEIANRYYIRQDKSSQVKIRSSEKLLKEYDVFRVIRYEEFLEKSSYKKNYLFNKVKHLCPTFIIDLMNFIDDYGIKFTLNKILKKLGVKKDNRNL